MNITDLLNQFGIANQSSGKHSRPGWVQIDCPDCGGGSQKFHLGINEASLGANCWQCGRKNLPYVLSTITNLSYQDAIRALKEIPRALPRPTESRGVLDTPLGIGDIQGAHWNYLAERGFDPDIIKGVWGVRGIGLAPKMAWRLWIPIDQNFQTVSWTTRAVGKRNKPRYISASPQQEIINHKHLLYGADLASNAIVITEGPTDAWRIGPGAVATLGLTVTPQQIQRMLTFPVRAVCFDNSVAAQCVARKLCSILSMYPGQTRNIQIDAEDPGSASNKEIQAIIKEVLT